MEDRLLLESKKTLISWRIVFRMGGLGIWHMQDTAPGQFIQIYNQKNYANKRNR